MSATNPPPSGVGRIVKANSEMREWLAENNFPVSARGKISKEHQEAYYSRANEELAQIMKPTGKTNKRRTSCGWCRDPLHDGRCIDRIGHCPGSVRNGTQAPEPIWYCKCAEDGHPGRIEFGD